MATANVPPEVKIISVESNGASPATIKLDADATDSDGAIAKVEFFRGTTLIGTAANVPFAVTWAGAPTGSYSITAKATDNLGSTSVTIATNVVVGPSPAKAYYVHSDQIDTARLITDGAGQAVWKSDLEPFGANLPDENPQGQETFAYNSRFPGQYYDRETGLHYNYLRDYDPQIGRYVQSDPIGLAGGINTYGYVGGHPLYRIDPLGLAEMGTIQCDGKGNYEIINHDQSSTRACTEKHEASHVKDWKEHYGPNSCKSSDGTNLPKGTLPMHKAHGVDYRDFLRDSECRAYSVSKECVKSCPNGSTSAAGQESMYEKNYCDQYDSWKREK
jgi:RHS repeat-associated protein